MCGMRYLTSYLVNGVIMPIFPFFFYLRLVRTFDVARYGDITAQTDGGKVFMLFYMLVSTVLVAGILGEFIDLYVCDMVGEGIIEQIM